MEKCYVLCCTSAAIKIWDSRADAELFRLRFAPLLLQDCLVGVMDAILDDQPPERLRLNPTSSANSTAFSRSAIFIGTQQLDTLVRNLKLLSYLHLRLCHYITLYTCYIKHDFLRVFHSFYYQIAKKSICLYIALCDLDHYWYGS